MQDENMTEVQKKLQTTLDKLRVFSENEITADDFNNFIRDIKSITETLHTELEDQSHLHQLMSITNFRTVDELSYVQGMLIRLIAPNKYGWPGTGWNKKGKYLYDLDQIELKLGGLIYKLNQQDHNA